MYVFKDMYVSWSFKKTTEYVREDICGYLKRLDGLQGLLRELEYTYEAKILG